MSVKLKIYLPGSDGPTIIDFPGSKKPEDIVFRQLPSGPLFTHPSKVIGIQPGATHWELVIGDDEDEVPVQYSRGHRINLRLNKSEATELGRLLEGLQHDGDPERAIVLNRIGRMVEQGLPMFKE